MTGPMVRQPAGMGRKLRMSHLYQHSLAVNWGREGVTHVIPKTIRGWGGGGGMGDGG